MFDLLLIFQIDYPETTNLHHIPSLQVSNISTSQQQQQQITASSGPNHITTIAANPSSIANSISATTPCNNFITATSAAANNIGLISNNNNGGSGVIQSQTQHTYRTGGGSLGSIGYCGTTTNIGIGGVNSGVYRTTNFDSSNMDHHHQIRHLPGGVNILFEENNVSTLHCRLLSYCSYFCVTLTFFISSVPGNTTGVISKVQSRFSFKRYKLSLQWL